MEVRSKRGAPRDGDGSGKERGRLDRYSNTYLVEWVVLSPRARRSNLRLAQGQAGKGK